MRIEKVRTIVQQMRASNTQSTKPSLPIKSAPPLVLISLKTKPSDWTRISACYLQNPRPARCGSQLPQAFFSLRYRIPKRQWWCWCDGDGDVFALLSDCPPLRSQNTQMASNMPEWSQAHRAHQQTKEGSPLTCALRCAHDFSNKLSANMTQTRKQGFQSRA